MFLGCAPNGILLLFSLVAGAAAALAKAHSGCAQLGRASCSSFGPDADKARNFGVQKQEYAIWNAAFVYNCAIRCDIGQKAKGKRRACCENRPYVVGHLGTFSILQFIYDI